MTSLPGRRTLNRKYHLPACCPNPSSAALTPLSPCPVLSPALPTASAPCCQGGSGGTAGRVALVALVALLAGWHWWPWWHWWLWWHQQQGSTGHTLLAWLLSTFHFLASHLPGHRECATLPRSQLCHLGVPRATRASGWPCSREWPSQ